MIRGLIARDDAQLHRLDRAIARIKERPPVEQRKMTCLLAALQIERAEILRYSSRAQQRARDAAVAA